MRAEDFQKQPLELAGWSVQLTSYRLGTQFLAEIEVQSSGVTIARATNQIRNIAEEQAIEAAIRRLTRKQRLDLDLTVGG
jgi:hypothetical protein